jgi:hypothetical protein
MRAAHSTAGANTCLNAARLALRPGIHDRVVLRIIIFNRVLVLVVIIDRVLDLIVVNDNRIIGRIRTAAASRQKQDEK